MPSKTPIPKSTRLSHLSELLFNLDAAFSVIDVETTGQSGTESNIMEIGIVRIEKRRIVDRYHSLIRPPVGIPPFISKMTGLTQDDLADAPVFSEIAHEVRERLAGTFLVAHNVQFDYAALKAEFLRLGEHFYMDRFCTVALARKFLPGLRRHNLDAVCEKLGIPVQSRHRALGDAEAAAAVFLHFLHLDDAESILSRYGRTFDKREKWTERLEIEIAKLPGCRGVYIFRDAMNLPLYVGKSNNIRSRIMSHLREDRMPKKKRLFKHTESFEAHPCDTELEALLMETRLIKKLQPPYNLQQNHRDREIFIRISADDYPKITISTERADDEVRYLGPFRSYRLVDATLKNAQKKFLLCPELMKARRNRSGLCFSYQVQKCCGACGKVIPAGDYRARVDEAAEWIETTISLSDEKSIDRFLKSAGARGEKLRGVREALKDTRRRMRELPNMFGPCFLIVDRKDAIGYLIKHNRLIRIFRGDELDDRELILEAAAATPSRPQDGVDETRTIQNFISNNRQRLRLVPIQEESHA
jgi:DNA polymerase-3 subunit epsilon